MTPELSRVIPRSICILPSLTNSFEPTRHHQCRLLNDPDGRLLRNEGKTRLGRYLRHGHGVCQSSPKGLTALRRGGRAKSIQKLASADLRSTRELTATMLIPRGKLAYKVLVLVYATRQTHSLGRDGIIIGIKSSKPNRNCTSPAGGVCQGH